MMTYLHQYFLSEISRSWSRQIERPDDRLIRNVFVCHFKNLDSLKFTLDRLIDDR